MQCHCSRRIQCRALSQGSQTAEHRQAHVSPATVQTCTDEQAGNPLRYAGTARRRAAGCRPFLALATGLFLLPSALLPYALLALPLEPAPPTTPMPTELTPLTPVFAQTAPEGSPLVLRGPWLQSASPTRLVIRWRTDEATDSVVWYGPSLNQLDQIVRITAARTEHEVTLTNLQPNTWYYYAVGNVNGILSGSELQHFLTPPPVGTIKPLRVWAIGDFGTGDYREISMRDSYYQFAGSPRADVWLMLGDNAYPDGTDADYQKAVFNVLGDILKTTPLWPTLGNHDAHSADSPTQTGPYYDIFVLPKNGEAGGVASNTEAYYSFDYANMHFICLDSADSNRGVTAPMAVWLKQDLAVTKADWIIAFWHHPPYSKGSHDSDTEAELIQMRENIVPLLETGGVDLVIAGHSHAYERSYLLNGNYDTSDTLTPSMILDGGNGNASVDGEYRKAMTGQVANQGAIYVVAGNGAALQSGPLNHPVMATSLYVMGSLILDVQGNLLEGRMLDSNGAFRDAFNLHKGTGAFPAQPGDFRLEPDSTSITLRWSDVSDAETGYELQRSTDKTTWKIIQTVAPNTIGYPDADIQSDQTYYYRMRTKTANDASPYTMMESAALESSGCSEPTARLSRHGRSVSLGAGLLLLGLGTGVVFFRKRQSGPSI